MLSVDGIDLSLGQLLVIPEGSNLRGVPCGCKLLLEQPRVDLGVLGCKVSGSCGRCASKKARSQPRIVQAKDRKQRDSRERMARAMLEGEHKNAPNDVFLAG
jgi:hypothetical protein